MKLSELIGQCEKGFSPEVYKLAFNSADVEAGTLFFCLNGRGFDGHDFINEALKNGAVAAVVDRLTDSDLPQILVDDTRSALAKAAQIFYGNPAKKLKIVGVTGTNGKTTTAYILKNIFDYAGLTAGLIGTNEILIGDKSYPSKLTTPDPIDLNSILADMVKAGVTHVVMEVSAHALALKKTDGIVFDIAAFTNLSQDHLDYFGDMDSYKKAKMRLFTPELCKSAVINLDDETGVELFKSCGVNKLSYGYKTPGDVFGVNLNLSEKGLSFVINVSDDIADIKFCLPGRFNMYNVMCAAACAKLLGISIEDTVQGVINLEKVDGRFNVIETPRGTVIIDYAHTDDGLKNVLKAIEEFATGRIITVFGCGGNRDKTKRPLMGKAAAEFSDYIYVTSDNPRFENPLDIISDITSAFLEINYRDFTVESDRKRAIEAALTYSRQGDIILIAGKGAENYQEIMGTKHLYNDEKFVLSLFGEDISND